MKTHLALYELTDEMPREHWIAVPHSTTAPKRAGTRIVRMREMTIGKTTYTIGQETVVIFDRERTIIDAFRYLSKEIAGVLALLRTKPERLSSQQKTKLAQFLKDNPAIEAIYQFQQQLHALLMHRAMTARWCRKTIPQFLEMIDALKKSMFKSLVALGRTLCQWKDEIARMWRFRKSNGITEGFHRKMKLIQRRAYGFRNFENYRIRVRVLCA